MHDGRSSYRRNLEPWAAHARALALDVEAFHACLEGGNHADAVRRDVAEAGKGGATYTPSFVLGHTEPDDPTKVEGVSFIRGAQAFPTLEGQLDAAPEALAGKQRTIGSSEMRKRPEPAGSGLD